MTPAKEGSTFHKDRFSKVRPGDLGKLWTAFDLRMQEMTSPHIWAWAKSKLHWVEVIPDDADGGWQIIRKSLCGKLARDYGRTDKQVSFFFDPVCVECSAAYVKQQEEQRDDGI